MAFLGEGNLKFLDTGKFNKIIHIKLHSISPDSPAPPPSQMDVAFFQFFITISSKFAKYKKTYFIHPTFSILVIPKLIDLILPTYFSRLVIMGCQSRPEEDMKTMPQRETVAGEALFTF